MLKTTITATTFAFVAGLAQADTVPEEDHSTIATVESPAAVETPALPTEPAPAVVPSTPALTDDITAADDTITDKPAENLTATEPAEDATTAAPTEEPTALVPEPQPIPQTVAACPSFEQPGDLYAASGNELYAPASLTVQAGGPLNIEPCIVGTFGFATEVPQISVNLTGMENYRLLEIEVFAQCDTTLLVNTPTGQWAFEDDNAGNFQPALVLPSSAEMNGRIDIWVGTYDGSACPATVELETWD